MSCDRYASTHSACGQPGLSGSPVSWSGVCPVASAPPILAETLWSEPGKLSSSRDKCLRTQRLWSLPLSVTVSRPLTASSLMSSFGQDTAYPFLTSRNHDWATNHTGGLSLLPLCVACRQTPGAFLWLPPSHGAGLERERVGEGR